MDITDPTPSALALEASIRAGELAARVAKLREWITIVEIDDDADNHTSGVLELRADCEAYDETPERLDPEAMLHVLRHLRERTEADYREALARVGGGR